MNRSQLSALRSISSRIAFVGLAATLALSVLACASGPRQLRGEVATSGFLGDYSMLKPGEGDQARQIYVKPGVSLTAYKSVMIDSVTLWSGGEHLSKLPKADQQILADRLYTALHDSLARDWKIVTVSGPGVLRLRAALTDAKAANVALDVLGTVIPQARMASTVAGAAADSAATVGSARVEAEIADSVSGERLLAAVDERVGTRGFAGLGDKWSDVQQSFDLWAERLRVRLGELK